MNPINPNQKRERSFLRLLGPIVLAVGLIFLAVGLLSFFAAFGGDGPPKYFWCAFVGMPVSFVGLVICKFAFMGKVARYAAGELAPVGKDTFNYMAKETKSGVSNISEAFVEGMNRAEGATVAERLNKLKQMKDAGLINEQDFEEQKDRILSEL